MIAGAIYYNCFYPGPIGLPANSAFTVPIEGRQTLLCLVRHLRPVVVTDFGNDFTYAEEGGLRHLALKRDIPAFNRDLIHADIRTSAGTVETIAAYGKAHEYVLYRRPSFSEFTFGIEVGSLDKPDANPAMMLTAINRLVLLYRVATRDVRVTESERLSRDFPVIREARVQYGAVPKPATTFDRLVAALPAKFNPIIFSFKEYEKFLPVFHHDLPEIAERVGHHLAVETKVSDAQRALIDAFEMLTFGGTPKFALVEALSIGEVLVFEFLARVRRRDSVLDRRLRREEEKHRLMLRKALTFLSAFLSPVWSTFPETLIDLNKVLNIRDKALHEQGTVTVDNALTALNAVQQLLFATEKQSEGIG